MKTSSTIAAPQTTSSGPEMLERRQHQPGDVARPDDEHLPVLVQVAGQEDDDADLRQLGRLEGDRDPR